MLYYLLYQIAFKQYGAGSESYFYKGLNVFQYVTFRTAWATITALLISLLFGSKVIKKLTALKYGQEIREELSIEHQAKKGTPTMGGILIIGAVFVSTLIWARIDSLYLWLALISTACFAAIGFADDYIKIVKKRSLAKEMTESAKNANLRETKFFDSSAEAGDFLINELKTGDLVLVKGSRGVRTEIVIEKLMEKFELEK